MVNNAGWVLFNDVEIDADSGGGKTERARRGARMQKTRSNAPPENREPSTSSQRKNWLDSDF
jgi:hypothetical protein